ncbi:HAD family hydrolase [Tetragenococcus solitarius]|uniref:HAD family hydrolase n=1 Tax=Tetragenococcus solitarius TaxID=71453 RepID=A0ABN3Y1K5_9ENTE|nr:HAD family hydrolase [Tetragenococcus solitarius]
MKRVFVFDIDDTLYDQLRAFKRAVENLQIGNQKALDIPSLYQLMKKYGDETFSSTGFDKEKLREMHVFRIKRTLQEYGIKINSKQAMQFQLDFEEYQNDIELFPRMEELLDLLVAEKQVVGVITNGTIDKQVKKIKALKLHKWIPKNNILISESIGVSKPKKSIFKCFEKALSLSSKNEIYYIGDNYLNDVLGPKAVGWNTIWVNYREHNKPIGCKADYIVQDPKSLYGLIAKLIKT